jgi:hypothetical protein
LAINGVLLILILIQFYRISANVSKVAKMIIRSQSHLVIGNLKHYALAHKVMILRLFI